MEGKAKFLAPKLSSLLKHVGYWKYKVPMLEINISFYDFNKDFVQPRMNVLSLLMTISLSYIFFWLMCPLTTSGNMCNLLLFMNFLLMVVQ
jgi:hypothetical protein